MWNNLTVNGFQFENSNDYAEARREADAIEYLTGKMDVSNPEIAIKVYYKLLDRQNLHTIVGYNFLKQLRDFCINSGIVNDSQIKSINMPSSEPHSAKIESYGDEISLEIDSAIDDTKEEVDKGFDEYDNSAKKTLSDLEKKLKRDIQSLQAKEKKLNTVAEHYRLKNRKLTCVIVGLALIIVCLFGLSIYKGSLPYDDVETEIQDKYAAWAEELAEREAAVKQKESSIEEGG